MRNNIRISIFTLLCCRNTGLPSQHHKEKEIGVSQRGRSETDHLNSKNNRFNQPRSKRGWQMQEQFVHISRISQHQQKQIRKYDLKRIIFMAEPTLWLASLQPAEVLGKNRMSAQDKNRCMEFHWLQKNLFKGSHYSEVPPAPTLAALCQELWISGWVARRPSAYPDLCMVKVASRKEELWIYHPLSTRFVLHTEL